MKSVALALALLAFVPLASPAGAGDREGLFANAHLLRPARAPVATIVLMSDTSWTAPDEAQATALVARGAAVIAIDTPAFLAHLETVAKPCIYAISDLETLAKRIGRESGATDWRPPILAGIGNGGTLALALIAQTPVGTLGGAIAVDPRAGLALTRPLCTSATKDLRDGRTVYGLSDTALPAPVTIVISPEAPATGVAHAEALEAAHPGVVVTPADGAPRAALKRLLSERIAAAGVDDSPLGLPLAVLPAAPTRDTMAVVFSGDGGWRDIDRTLGLAFQAQGVPVIGVDSLRYFWSERTPEATAQDLSRIIATYTSRWNVKNVLLVGYSFGADVLGAAVNRLPQAERAKVRQISLLGLSTKAAWEISVAGWLGVGGHGPATLPELERIDPTLLQCCYGQDETGSLCPVLAARGVEVVRTAGGHHFDGNYAALATDILTGLDRRLAR